MFSRDGRDACVESCGRRNGTRTGPTHAFTTHESSCARSLACRRLSKKANSRHSSGRLRRGRRGPPALQCNALSCAAWPAQGGEIRVCASPPGPLGKPFQPSHRAKHRMPLRRCGSEVLARAVNNLWQEAACYFFRQPRCLRSRPVLGSGSGSKRQPGA